MDRFKSPCIESHRALEKVMCYVDLNPKRAGLVQHPKNYKWSSFCYYAYGKEDALITPAPNYLKMGKLEGERQKNYLAMVEKILKADWKEKKPYSSVAFVGNPVWVEQKVKDLRFVVMRRRANWRERFVKKFLQTG